MSPDKARALLEAEFQYDGAAFEWAAFDRPDNPNLHRAIRAIQASAVAEREAVVAWLRGFGEKRGPWPQDAADTIERGDHLASAGGAE